MKIAAARADKRAPTWTSRHGQFRCRIDMLFDPDQQASLLEGAQYAARPHRRHGSPRENRQMQSVLGTAAILGFRAVAASAQE